MRLPVSGESFERKEKKDPERGKRFARAAETYGRLVGASTMKEFALSLGQNEWDFYNWKKGHKPGGGVARLAAIYEPLRAKGVNPVDLAEWVFTADGEMPRPVGGAVAPDVSPRVPAAQPVVRGNRAEQLLEDTIAQARLAETAEEKNKILDGGLRLVRDAKQLGLAVVAGVGVGLTLLVGGADASSFQAPQRVAQANQPFFSPTRRRRGAHHGPAPRGLVTRFASVRVTTPSVVLKRSTGT